ncbi:MAG: hypothetical protein O3A51_14600 [Verrucomicrobia bacterium]|nr:hypothetical protein [Verrucomicrobiota bacterium]
MRTYISLPNLARAVVLGGGMTLLSIPRLLQGSLSPVLYVATALLCLTMLAGMMTAWSAAGGMTGFWPGARRRWVGCGVAVLLGAMLVPLLTQWLDPMIKQALIASGHTERLQLQFPETRWQQAALILWVAGFQVLFFTASAMSLFSRLTKRWPMALVLAVILRLSVAHVQFDNIPIASMGPIYGMHAVSTAISCTLFARAGLLPAILFALVLSLHHLQ